MSGTFRGIAAQSMQRRRLGDVLTTPKVSWYVPPLADVKRRRSITC
jgi:hypothetical protein